MVSTADSDPYLPPELEHIIFVLASRNGSRDAQNLMLVARRVLDWVIPHVFSIVKLSDRECLPFKFNETTYKKYGHHTHHLWLGMRPVSLGQSLDLFPNVVNLSLWEYNPAYLPLLLKLPLTYLTIRYSQDLIPMGLIPVLTGLTHLALDIPWEIPPSIFNVQLYLPKLTHLCIDSDFIALEELITFFLAKERCPALRVMVISTYHQEKDPKLDVDGKESVNDERIVVMYRHGHEDWFRGARGELDMWRFAEGVLEERKQKVSEP